MTLQDMIRNKKKYGGIGTGGRKEVWRRDGSKCRMCKHEVIDDRKAGGYAGEVHHLNKDTTDKQMVNKILVCRFCHSFLHHLSEEEYVKKIKKITGMKTEVITDKKTFKILNMAERGATMNELCKAVNYSEETVLRQLSGFVHIEKLWEQDCKENK